MVLLWMKTVWDALGRQATAIGVAILAVISLVLGHRYKVKQAGRTGRKEGEMAERERIQVETEQVSAKMEERADEVHESAADLASDELAERMRVQQKRLRNR